MPAQQPVIPLDDALYVTTDAQLRAVNNLLRHRILRTLRETPATTTHVAHRLGIRKGSASYHLRLLQSVGMITVIDTRKVRGVMERYYAPVSRRIILPDPGTGQPDILMRHAVADLEAAPTAPPRFVALGHARIGTAGFAEISARLEALIDELTAEDDPDGAPVELAVALFRPEAKVASDSCERQ